MAAAVIGCDRTASAPGGGKVPAPGDLIVLIGPAQPNAQWAGIAGGARRFVAKYASLRLETAAPPDSSSEALLRVVHDALSKEPSAICLYVSDADAARPAAGEVVKNGTLLVTMGVSSDVTGVFGHVRVDLPGGAELLGEHLEEIAGGKQSYVLLHSHGATPTDTRCYERFMRKARSFHGMTLLEQRDAAEAEQPPTELLRAMFARFRYAGLAVTFDPTPWLCTPPAELLGKNARFATLSAAPALWRYLRSGEAAALAGPLDGEIGSLAAEIALVGITGSGKAGLARTAESELVTRERLDDFAKRYAEAAGLDLNELWSARAASQPAAPPRPVVEP